MILIDKKVKTISQQQKVSEQQNKASSPDVSAYISASAGSGKTKVIIDRILRLLLNNVPIENILCITFTNAASDEMINRLSSKLHHWFNISDNELISEISQLINNNNNVDNTHNAHNNLTKYISLAKNLYIQFLEKRSELNIRTLHSFCKYILELHYQISFNSSEDLEYKFNLYNEGIISSDNNPNNHSTLQKYLIMDYNIKNKLIKESLNYVLENLKTFIQEDIDILVKIYDYSTLLNLVISSINKQYKLFQYFKYDEVENYNEQIDYIKNEDFLPNILSEIRQNVCSSLNASYNLTSESLIKQYISQINKEDYAILIKNLITEKESSGDILNKWFEYDLENKIINFFEFKNIFLTLENKARARLPISAAFKKKHEDIAIILHSEQNNLESLYKEIKLQDCSNINAAFNVIIYCTHKKYIEKKIEKKYMEYDDLINKTIKLLKEANGVNELLYNIDMSIDHVLIDEAQDLSRAQWDIVALLTSEFYSGKNAREDLKRTLFIVGDFKQSIYGFQGAEPNIFNEINEFYKAKFTSIGYEWLNINMNNCFRCSTNIINVVNSVLKDKVFVNAFSSINVDEHISINENTINKVELWDVYIDNCLDNEDDININNIKPKTQYLELRWYERMMQIVQDTNYNDHNYNENNTDNDIDNNIDNDYCVSESFDQIDFIAKQISLKISERLNINTSIKCQSSDIMILFRKRCLLQNQLIKYLRKLNIEVNDLTLNNIKNHIMIYDLIVLGKFASTPYNEMNLAILLKTPFFNCSEEFLFKILYNRKNNLFDILRESNDSEYLELYKKLENISAIYSEHNSIKDFYINFLYINNYKEKLLPEFYADITYMEIDELLTYFWSMIDKFESENIGMLYDFIKWFEDDSFINKKNSDNKDGIKITTIHGAKGLESPIIILADAGMSSKSQRDNVIFDDKCLYINLAKNFTCEKLYEIKNKYKIYLQQENLRLLYVAMTRARNELYIVSNIAKNQKNNDGDNDNNNNKNKNPNNKNNPINNEDDFENFDTNWYSIISRNI